MPEGTFLPQIDYNMAVWLAYQNCLQLSFMRHTEDFSQFVKILTTMVLPDWEDQDYKDDIQKAMGQPIYYFQAITNLLHRRGFFEIKSKDFGHL